MLGVLTLARPSPWLYALQSAAVVGYTAMAALNMPELTVDHCGPLVKNLPVLGLVVLLWLAQRVPAHAMAASIRLPDGTYRHSAGDTPWPSRASNSSSAWPAAR